MYNRMLAAQPSASAPEEALRIAPPSVSPPAQGALLVFGSTNWQQMGKKLGVELDGAPNLLSPHRLLGGLGGVRVVYIASSCVSAHVIALGEGGEAFSWGRNDSGQLGHGDTTTRATPTRVASLKGKTVGCATGKAHSLFVSEEGGLCGCGASKTGCVGPAGLKNKKSEHEASPLTIPLASPVAAVSCGSNFCLARDKEASHPLHWPCHGTCYTWGNAGHGRLGHKDQKDRWVPAALPEIKAESVQAGMAHSLALAYPVCKGAPSVYMWGRVNPSRDAWMYPKPEDELRGWSVHAFGVGHNHNVVHADSSIIAWGSPCASGELGFGPGDLASPSLAHHTSIDARTVRGEMLVTATVDALPEFTPVEVAIAEEEAEPPKGQTKASSKRKASPAASAAKKGKK
ncbi:MAG: hypothetical protein SGPRY_005455 [Prymnesium sp.]